MKNLAIIGGGSSGLIALKTALDHLTDWNIYCFEKTNSILGCWGNPHADFISTSTKYTTQFSCFPKYSPSVDPKHGYNEFFKGNEYGTYLENFANEFDLKKHIYLNTEVTSISKDGERWKILTDNRGSCNELVFSEVIVCTGLTEKPKVINSDIPTIQSIAEIESIKKQVVVVIGGGESAADIANRLSHPEKENTVYLSLKNGIRVSPRYHPIRGVPSDFLRNRLMLGISQGVRNKIGKKFVEARIKYQNIFQTLFPQHRNKQLNSDSGRTTHLKNKLKKEWDFKLTEASKDHLFNMFHNKSDSFLDAVGEGRIKIIGAQKNITFSEYSEFQSDNSLFLKPDLIVPMTGYESNLSAMFSHKVHLSEFYLGCTHQHYSNLHLIGFARPIIGNIPSISEQQALYIIKTISGEIERPKNIKSLHETDQKKQANIYPKINRDAVYPVEMFPYCDTLAKLNGIYPQKKSLNMLLSPATTLHYLNYNADPSPIYTPSILNGLLFTINFFDKKK